MLIRSILVVKPSSLGDVVHTLPTVAILKRAWPQAHLRWLINPEWAPLLEGNPDVNEIVLFPRRELGGATKVFKQLHWLKSLGKTAASDLVLDFQGLLRSAIAGRAARSRGGQFLGLSDAREGARFFYDRAARTSPAGHAVDRYLQLAALLGIETAGPLEWRLPEGSAPVPFKSQSGSQAGGRSESEPEPGPFVLLHPFSRGAGKSLSVEDTEQLSRSLPFPVVLAGRSDVPTGLIDRLPNVTNLLNRTSLAELIWLIRKARFVVSVDSGPMHIAAALKKPLLSIHTWSDPARVGPYDPEAWILQDQTLFQMKQRSNSVEKRRAAPDMAAIAAFVEEVIRR